MSTTTYSGLRLPDLVGAAARPGALLSGVLVVRWCVLVWLVLLLLLGEGRLHVPLGVAAVAVASGWTLLLTVRRPTWGRWWLLADLVVCGGLLGVAAVAPSLATVYPVAAAATWGAVRGARGGALAGAVLGAVYVGAHVLEGLTLDTVDESVLDVTGDAFSLVLAGAGVGLVSTLVQRSGEALRTAEVERLRAVEDAARLAEREALAREVHDSVLQSLALVHKRGRELAAGAPSAEDVRDLADLAARQERHVRELLLAGRGPASQGAATASVRGRLLAAAAAWPSLQVHVGSVLERPLPAAVVEQVGAAVEQCLANVERHAGTREVWVLAEHDADALVVTVRDAGVGFDPGLPEHQARLDREGRMGLRHSVVGRVADLGGTTVVTSAPGRGTEVEMRVPLPSGHAVRHDA